MEFLTKEDFAKVVIKIGTVVECTKAENADKLLLLQVDFGNEKRQIVTAMAAFYGPQDFIGKQFPFLLSIEPKEFRGHVSQGMIVAIDTESGPVKLVPEKTVANGASVI